MLCFRAGLHHAVSSGGVDRSRCSGLGGVAAGLEPAVEPAEEYALPHHCILGLENLMVLIGEYEHFGRHSAQTCGIECHHALRGKNAEVIFAVSDEYWGIPFVNEAVG